MQFISTLTILALFSSAQAALDIVQPTGQCTDQHAVGDYWTCASGVFGCKFKGVDSPCNRPNDDKNIGRQFCDVSKGETIVIGQGQGSKSIGGDKCYSSYVWVMADYTWQCCSCPAGYQPAGEYTSQDATGGFTYNYTITGGSVEKTCMRCTGAGEKLTYNYAEYKWSCQSGTSSTTTSSSKTSSATTSSSTTNGGTIVIPRTTTTTTTTTTKSSTTTSSKTTTTTSKKTTTASPTTLKTSTKSTSKSITTTKK